MEIKDVNSELGSIRSMMDRSAKFVAVSGLSVIMAGAYSLLGIAIAWLIQSKNSTVSESFSLIFLELPGAINSQSVIIALLIMTLSIGTAFYLTARKVANRGENIWNPEKKYIISSMSVPLLSGGLLMSILLYHGELYTIAPVSLIFYGLALVAGSQYTVSLIKYLGYSEILLGLLAALFPDNGIYLWIMGFSIMNIIFGFIIYIRYER